MDTGKIPRTCGTHDGTFHADEVTACALLVVFDLIDQDKIIRTRDPETLNRCEYVCDVGGIYDAENKLFDHHQADYQGPLSSAGMLLEYLLQVELVEKPTYEILRYGLIMGVDDHDNGLDPQIPGVCTYSHIMTNFTTIHYDSSVEEIDQAFKKALEFAIGNLSRMIERYHYICSCREIVEAAMKNGDKVLMFDKAIPWIDAFFELDGINHMAEFVIMPSGKHWKLRGVPPTKEDRMEVRRLFPEEWAGLLDEELKEKTGINGAIFCHKGLFISIWETKEDALKALKYIMN